MFDPFRERIYDPEPIVNHGHLNSDTWKKIEQRSEEKKIPIFPKCPACQTQITTLCEGGYGCRRCQKPADVSLQRENTDDEEKLLMYTNADTILRENRIGEVSEIHAFYLKIGGQTQLIRRVALKCLSCQAPSRKIVIRQFKSPNDSYIETYYCANNCGIRTYYQLKDEETQLCLVPAFHSETLSPKQTDPFEIPEAATPSASPHEEPVTETPQRRVETDQTASDPQRPAAPVIAPPSNAKKDVEGQMLKYLTHAPRNTATTAEMRNAFGCSRQGLKDAADNLIEAGKIRRLKRGVYEFINHKPTE